VHRPVRGEQLAVHVAQRRARVGAEPLGQPGPVSFVALQRDRRSAHGRLAAQ
jgi:hypothetical protein